MLSNCPHCNKSIEVPSQQADVQCPNCKRFFLWIPNSSQPEEENIELDEAELNALHAVINKRTQQADYHNSGLESDNSNSEFPDTENVSAGLYNTYTPGTANKKEPERPKSGGKTGPKTGKDMYPYELPGQVVEADRRMPVFSSMMSDGLVILSHNFGRVLKAVIVFAVLFGFLTACSFAAMLFISELPNSIPWFDLNCRIISYTVILTAASVLLVWILNGQCEYIVSLIRIGKSQTSLLFSGSDSLFKNWAILLIHIAPLIFPAVVCTYYYNWWFYSGLPEQVQQSMGYVGFVMNQTPLPVAIAIAVMGIGIFLVIILNWGLAYWLTLDKSLGFYESLEVSHKITYEKKGTFLAILVTSIGGVVVLSAVTMGIGIVLFPVALLFVGMYYMKTAIQEMVIPGKTELGAHISLYGTEGELSDKNDEEEDIL